jgi:hypothetical protein
VQNGGDLTHPVIRWNDLIEAKQIEQLSLVVIEALRKEGRQSLAALC